jgi:hypothetical protein
VRSNTSRSVNVFLSLVQVQRREISPKRITALPLCRPSNSNLPSNTPSYSTDDYAVVRYITRHSPPYFPSSPMSQPTAVAMPQPTYAYDKPLGGTHPPPNGYTQHPASDVPHGYNQYPAATPESNDYPAGAKPESAGREIARTPSPTSSEIDLLNGVKKPKSLGTKLSEIFLVFWLLSAGLRCRHRVRCCPSSRRCGHSGHRGFPRSNCQRLKTYNALAARVRFLSGHGMVSPLTKLQF